jgi:hypothetical protein
MLKNVNFASRQRTQGVIRIQAQHRGLSVSTIGINFYRYMEKNNDQ